MKKNNYVFKGSSQNIKKCYLSDVMIVVKNLNKSYDISLEIVISSEK